jgi:ribose 5-phosphate isomerase B
MKMKIVIANDHAGFHLKTSLKKWLDENGYDVHDLGTYSEDSVDYPDFAHKLADDVEQNPDEAGLLVCGSGNGVAMAANKHKGIRAALAWNPEIASLARQHNNANVLCLPARFISEAEAFEIVKAFFAAEFEGGRHQKRVEKI